MEKVYKDSSGNPCPLVTVYVDRQVWTAKSDSPECVADVNGILNGLQYTGDSDRQNIVNLMEPHGFKPINEHGQEQNQVPIKEIVFDHTATAAAM